MKKGLKVFLVVFLSIVSLLITATIVIKLNMCSICIDIINSELNKISEKNPGIKFETGYLDEGISSRVALNNLKIAVNGKDCIRAERVSLHAGLFTLIKELIENRKLALEVRVSGLYADVDGKSLVTAGVISEDTVVPEGRVVIDDSDVSFSILIGVEGKNFTVSPLKFEAEGFIKTDLLDGVCGEISSDYFLNAAFYDEKIKSEVDFENLCCLKAEDVVLKGKLEVDGELLSENPSFAAVFNVESNVFNLSFNAAVSDYVADFQYLALSALDYNFRYKGSFSLESFIPEGSFVLNKAESDKVILIADLWENNEGIASFSFGFPDYPDLTYSGVVKTVTGSEIAAQTYLITKYQKIPLDMDFLLDELRFVMKNDDSEFNIAFEENSVLRASVSLDSFKYSVAENFDLMVDGLFSGDFDLKKQSFTAKLDDLIFKVSNLFFFGFDMNLDNKNVYFSDIVVGNDNERTQLRGDVNFGYADLQNLLKGKSEGISFTTDLNNDGTEEHLKIVYDGETFLADIILGISNRFVLQLMLDPSDNLMGRVAINDLSFDAEYRNNKVRIYNPQGKFGLVKLEDLNVEYSIESGVLSGDGIISSTGEIEQGGSFTFSGKIDEFEYSSSSNIGFAVDGNINVSVFDAYLGDDFSFKNNSFDCHFTNNDVQFTGDIINGNVSFKDKHFDLNIDKDFLFGFNATGYYGEEVNIMLDEIYFPISIINQFIEAFYLDIDGDYLDGSVYVKGPSDNPSFYGMLYSRNFNFDLYWVPDQNISAKGLFISLQDHTIRLEQTHVVGYRESDHRLFNGTFKAQLDFNNWKLTYTELDIDFPDDDFEFILPIGAGATIINIEGEAKGNLALVFDGERTWLNADLISSDTLFTFDKKVKEEKSNDTTEETESTETTSENHSNDGISADVNLVTGKNFALAYPNEENAFISFSLEEGENLHIVFDSKTNSIDSYGTAKIKTGRIFYFSNDFLITDGVFSLNRPLYDESQEFMFSVDLTAKIKELDMNGNPVEIYLILKDSDIPNIKSHLESSPYMTENEILAIVKQDFISGTDLTQYSNSLSTIASSAVHTSDTLSTLGITTSRTNNFSISSQIRNLLGLDMFSLRLPFFQNFVVSTISNKSEMSLPARIMNGTSLFAGKYFTEDLFVKVSAQLKSLNSSSKGNLNEFFISEDLKFNFELSLDWENPLGTYSFFVQPQELSVSSFLDTIGFSFAYSIKL